MDGIDPIFDKYFSMYGHLEGIGVKYAIISAFVRLVRGKQDPKIIGQIYSDSDAKATLTPEDYATWKRMTA